MCKISGNIGDLFWKLKIFSRSFSFSEIKGLEQYGIMMFELGLECLVLRCTWLPGSAMWTVCFVAHYSIFRDFTSYLWSEDDIKFVMMIKLFKSTEFLASLEHKCRWLNAVPLFFPLSPFLTFSLFACFLACVWFFFLCRIRDMFWKAKHLYKNLETVLFTY